jgi:UDP-sugar transporter A1/2/3
MESLNLNDLKITLTQQIFNNPMDSLKTGVPAILYTVQTTLVYLAISNLDAAVFQVTFQIKILTTAIFTVLLLNRSLRGVQWASLFILITGISIIQIQSVKSSSSTDDKNKNPLFGLICVIMACVLSGLAGVYFEKILKNSKVSIWVRNIQLGLFGSSFALVTVYLSDFEAVKAKGFFFGYNTLVWINILVQAGGGLLVAIVIKYADNILKGFATSIAIIISCLASAYLFGTVIDLVFTIGTFLVVLSVVLYSYVPPGSSSLPQTTNPNVSQSLSGTSSLSSSPKAYLTNENVDSELVKYKIESSSVINMDGNS